MRKNTQYNSLASGILFHTALFVGYAISLTAQAEEMVSIEGKVSQVLSGDSFILTHPQKGTLSIHLWGVEAPELASNNCKAQPWAEQAQRYLQRQITQQSVTAICLKQLDNEGFAHCRVQRGTLEVNRVMISQGYAWFDKRLSNDLLLQQAEQQARNDKIGLWSDRLLITAPWKYRQQCAN